MMIRMKHMYDVDSSCRLDIYIYRPNFCTIITHQVVRLLQVKSEQSHLLLVLGRGRGWAAPHVTRTPACQRGGGTMVGRQFALLGNA